REMLPEFSGTLVRCGIGGCASNDSGGRERALNHGSVFESAASGGVRGGFRGRPSAGEKVPPGSGVADICRCRSSFDGGVCLLLLCSAAGDGEVREAGGGWNKEGSCSHGCRLPSALRDFACSTDFAGISRGGSASRLPLYPALAVV